MKRYFLYFFTVIFLLGCGTQSNICVKMIGIDYRGHSCMKGGFPCGDDYVVYYKITKVIEKNIWGTNKVGAIIKESWHITDSGYYLNHPHERFHGISGKNFLYSSINKTKCIDGNWGGCPIARYFCGLCGN